MARLSDQPAVMGHRPGSSASDIIQLLIYENAARRGKPRLYR